MVYIMYGIQRRVKNQRSIRGMHTGNEEVGNLNSSVCRDGKGLNVLHCWRVKWKFSVFYFTHENACSHVWVLPSTLAKFDCNLHNQDVCKEKWKVKQKSAVHLCSQILATWQWVTHSEWQLWSGEQSGRFLSEYFGSINSFTDHHTTQP